MSAVIDNLTSVIENQRIKINEKQVDFLDDLTKQFLKDFILKTDYTNTREAALYGIIFPKDYSHDVITTRQKYDISCPFLHQIEFLINGNENSKLDINFNFLQPIIQKPGTKSSMRDPNTGQEYKKGVRDTISQQVSCSVTLNEILSDTKIHNFNFNENSQEIKIWKDGTQQDDNERPLFTVKRISHHVLGNISISSLKITDSLYKITVKIENLTPIELGESKDLRQKEVWKYAFFGAQTEIKISEGNPISFNENDPSLKLPLKSCTSLNTITKLSSSSENKIFASPIGILDFKRSQPEPMDITLTKLCESEELFLDSLHLLDGKQKTILKDSGKLLTLMKIFSALRKTYEQKFESLFKFQFDAIQYFIQSLLEPTRKPLIVRAPTDSGKSIVYYMCTAIEKEFSETSATSSFILLPTRALNATQFQEITKFFYFLRKEGLEITLGLFLGQQKGQGSVSKPELVNSGDPIFDIKKCPKCNSSEIIAEKPHIERIIPKCKDCKEELDFIFLNSKETARFCPNVVIGTPDKLARDLSLSFQSHNLFGCPMIKCKNCKLCTNLLGKSQNNLKQNQELVCDPEKGGCGEKLDTNDIIQSNPSLITFDEIHTMTGTSGNLFSHFLSLLKIIKGKYGLEENLNYLGATATVANEKQLLENLTQKSEFTEIPKKDETSIYFKQLDDDIRHRFVLVEPEFFTVADSTQRLSVNIFQKTDEIINQNPELKDHYRMQSTYVKRKDDGERFSTDLSIRAQRELNQTPIIEYAHGDLSTFELNRILKSVEKNEVDVLTVTSILGLGVDFPNLNIINFWGAPETFIEFFQAIGRTGRGNAPSIIFLHLRGDIPRDQFVYQNSEEVFLNMNSWVENLPINAMNQYAIDQSLMNIVCGLMITRQKDNYKIMWCDEAYNSVTQGQTKEKQVESFKEFMSELEKVYRRNLSDIDWAKLASGLAKKVYDTLESVKDEKNESGYPAFLNSALSLESGGPGLLNSVRIISPKLDFEDKDYESDGRQVNVESLLRTLSNRSLF